ncbi:MAG: lipid-A-disaccharide synthase [Planctomycetota bacterium]|nr:lipid-A-disaccharide synthase [Planctomycetota bacterium]
MEGPKVFIVAGEDSGDHLGAALLEEMRQREPGIDGVGLGGPRMEAAGCRILYHLPGLSVMWFSQVFRRALTFYRIFRKTLRWIEEESPALVILIDFPGFNLRLARRLRRRQIPVIYYVSPQVWAWAPGRVRSIAASVDRMLVLFPFEKKIYERAGVPVDYVGHPLFDALQGEEGPTEDRDPLVGILPGSRLQEVRLGLPVMLRAARRLASEVPDLDFAVSCARQSFRPVIERALADLPLPARIVEGSPRDILRRSKFCFMTSGSGTLECMYFETPMVIVYRVTPAAYLLSLLLKTSRYIGLVNVLAGMEIVPEYLDFRDRSDDLADEAIRLIRPGPDRERCLAGLRRLKAEILEPGAAGRAAEAVLQAVSSARGEARVAR